MIVLEKPPYMVKGSLIHFNIIKEDNIKKELKGQYENTVRHPDIRGKHGFIWTFTSIAVILYADVSAYKMESCGKKMI